MHAPADPEYDYVIVGAGSAGCVMAARLSEDPTVTVLLLEAGGLDDADEEKIPAALYRLFKSAYDWNYTTEPQAGADGRRLFWPRGKMLGGSSSMNAMLYVRGNRLDYDTWRDRGALGWSSDDLWPYFPRAEDNERGRGEHHGVGGPRSRRASRPTRTSTARSRTGPVSTRSPSAQDADGRRPMRTCVPSCTGATSPCSPTPSPTAW